MEIESVFLAKYDFYRLQNRDQVDESLTELFESRNELSTQDIEFDGRDIEIDIVHFYELSDESFDEFGAVNTFLILDSDVKFFVHLITVVPLALSEVSRIIPGNPTMNRSTRQEWRSKLNEVTSLFPQSLINPDISQPILMFLDHGGTLSYTLSTSEPSVINSVIEDNSDTLSGFGFNSFGDITRIDSTHIVSADNQKLLSTPLSIFAIHIPMDSPADAGRDDWKDWIEFEYRRLRSITNLIMIRHWLTWRTSDIDSLDSESYGFQMPQVDPSASVEDVRDTEHSLEQMRREWVQTQSVVMDEYQNMRYILDSYELTDGERTKQTNFDTAVTNSSDGSYLFSNVRMLEQELSTLSQTLERVENKFGMFTDVVHDRIQSKATDSNLSLQTKVTYLTYLLAAIAIVEFYLRYFPQELIQSASITMTTTGLFVLISAIAIIAGIIGYTHG